MVVNAGEVLTIRLRWTDQNGDQFPFDATVGPGYVWHCHLLEHEDNEMMRPYIVVLSAQNLSLEIMAVIIVVVIVIAVLVILMILKRLSLSFSSVH